MTTTMPTNTKGTKYFNKSPSNFFRIPESRYFRQHAAYDVYEFLVDMAYRKEVGFYGNNSHVASARMAEAYREGYVTTFTTISLIETYRGLSKNTVKDALKLLVRMTLIFPEDTEDGNPWHRDGMLYKIGERIRDENGKVTKKDRSYLEMLDDKCAYPDGAKMVQAGLIKGFRPNAEPLPILNIRFDDIDTRVVREAMRGKFAKRRKESTYKEEHGLLIENMAADY